ncbi:hypothetical protein MJO29_014782 [Puccinia striiformis f. sp. tritici]|uniref:SH3 domain-containing protein n=1 Tax=Puccinia striiformis TaxID=27350 RepID=A0A2S4VY55_9BASI|nr:hypothetical protein Pst134EA_027870 [Puccinia striiformis f. sp. tritici]KAH9448560.1 hypothetical protein Pst134EA_027870 [Puccinia striiformis f. sp. tritici]KAI7937467.1 hypothetical protein MJO29_014782 [Puccinia striiformis f. sp. tritici]KAI9608017.1 hypothetical protein H4Q26_005470 [Puccinia striiformis f. sp. tritici PST-130]POW14409.1 hypothetical protein PSHT_07441 [Puccinia striiformis]
MSHCTTAAETQTMSSTANSRSRPMSTSIIPSLSLDSRQSTSNTHKRISTPFLNNHSPSPKRPSSTSQAALASSQTRVALNLLHRLSTQNSSSLRLTNSSASPPSIIIRDFAFKITDPRHTGQRLPSANDDNDNDDDQEDEEEDLDLNHHRRTSSSNKPAYWNICASPTPGSTAESEYDRDEAEQSIEIDKLINKQRQDSSTSHAKNGALPAVGTGGGGGEQILRKLSSKYENLYVSLYDFVAEGESEMNLNKGEIVSVLEIICDGWVVAKKTKLVIDDDGRLFSPDHSDLLPIQVEDLSQFLVLSTPNNNITTTTTATTGIDDDDDDDDEEGDHSTHVLSLTGLCPENYLLKIS